MYVLPTPFFQDTILLIP
jgi:hypothetical protein